MNTHILDKSEISEIIGETLDYLKQHAIIAHHEDAHVFIGQVMNGYRHLSDRYTAWPAAVHDGEIDLANPATSPLNMVVARFHLDPLQHLNFLDAKWCQDRGFLLIDFKGEAERKIKNELWNRLICASREKALSSYPEKGVKILFLAA